MVLKHKQHVYHVHSFLFFYLSDWVTLCLEVRNLHHCGELSVDNIKDLVGFIERKDTVLLEAFRSSRNSGTPSEFRTKFKQYLSGLIPRL